MSQVSTVFLIELGERGTELAKLLTRSGFDGRAVALAELPAALDQRLPEVIVADHVQAETIAALLRGRPGSTEITFFAMAPESAGPHVKGSLPREVTAVVRDDIDPGILSLRLKAATQHTPGHRSQSQTLMGVVVPPGLSSRPTAAAGPVLVQSAPQSKPPAASQPPAAPSQPAAAPSQPAAAPSQPPAPWSPPQASQPAPVPTMAPSSSAPPSAPGAVSPAPSPSVGASVPGAQGSGPPAQVSGVGSPPSTPSVTMTSDDVPDFSARSRKLKTWLAAAGAVVVLGAGGIWTMSGSKGADVPVAATQAAATAAAQKAEPPAPAPAATAESPAPAPAAPAEEPKAEDSASAHELYKVSNITTIDDCDKALDKPAEYYKKQPKWKAAQSWKTARKYLLQGKDELAFSQMCQSVSVDPGSQALGGLVNFFLRHRALDQAQAWAERGMTASKSNRTAKEALGDTFSQLGKVDEARTLWLETAKLTVDKKAKMQAVARNWLKLAKQASKGGDLTLAERLLRRAATFDEDNAEVATELAIVLQKNEQPLLAKNWAQRALELDPKAKEAQAILDSLK